MKTTLIVLTGALLAGNAFAQGAAPSRTVPGSTPPEVISNAPIPGANSSTGTTLGGAAVDSSSTATASGNHNQAVATTSANAPQPAHGHNSFTEGEARRRIEKTGLQHVTGLKKDKNGVWRGTATQAGHSVPVWIDYKGNISPAREPTSTYLLNPVGARIGLRVSFGRPGRH